MKLISEMREGDIISDVYLCKTKQILKTKMGKTYYSLLLQDKSGTVDAKIWELNNAIGYFESMDYIRVEGQITVCQGANQLNIRRLRKAQEGEYIPADYMPCTDKDVKAMQKELVEMIRRTKNPYLETTIISADEIATKIWVRTPAFFALLSLSIPIREPQTAAIIMRMMHSGSNVCNIVFIVQANIYI